MNVCDVARECETLDHRSTLPVTKEIWQQLQFASEQDLVLQKLRDISMHGWPANKLDVPECVRPYFDSRDELTLKDALVFNRDLLVVPTSMCRELLAVAHSTHIGIGGCIRPMRDTLYWPRMAKRFEDRCRNARFVSHTEIHQARNRLYSMRSSLDLGRKSELIYVRVMVVLYL